jgi:hypothetical protein
MDTALEYELLRETLSLAGETLRDAGRELPPDTEPLCDIVCGISPSLLLRCIHQPTLYLESADASSRQDSKDVTGNKSVQTNDASLDRDPVTIASFTETLEAFQDSTRQYQDEAPLIIVIILLRWLPCKY